MNEITLVNYNLPDEVRKKIIEQKLEFEQKEREWKETKDALFKMLEDNNIKKLELDGITITYKDEYTRESFNTKKFRKDHPDMYDDYTSISTVKPSVLIDVRED